MSRVALFWGLVGLVVPACLHGQIRREPGVVVDGKVVVRVYVVLRDDQTPYYPVVGAQLRFFRSARDSVVVTTDEAGAATTLLEPGEYRLVSASDVFWKGNHYSWSVPLTVRPGMYPIDLREPPAATTVVIKDATPTTVAPGGGPPAVRHSEREGFWLSIGLGYGSLGCDACDGRLTGGSGNISLGGTLSPHVLLGVFSNAWTKTEGGATATAGTLTAGIRVYPSATAGFFLTAGVGGGQVSAQVPGVGSASNVGSGALLGLGWDIRLGKAVSLTPFFNGAGIVINGYAVNFGQLGLGITWN